MLIPQSENANDIQSPGDSSQSSLTSPSAEESLNQNQMSVASSTRSNSFDEDNIREFLSKIDASIASTKEVVKKVTSTSQ